jgi:hypothetical protein
VRGQATWTHFERSNFTWLTNYFSPDTWGGDSRAISVKSCRPIRAKFKVSQNFCLSLSLFYRLTCVISDFRREVQGPGVALWLRHCATSRKVLGSIPGVAWVFSVASDSSMCPGINSASKNEYQVNPGGKGWQPTTFMCRCQEIWGP